MSYENYEIRLFEQSLIKYINDSDVPIEVKRIIISSVLNQLTEAANKEVEDELTDKKAKENTEKK